MKMLVTFYCREMVGKNLAVIYQKWSERTPGIISDLPGDESRPNKQ